MYIRRLFISGLWLGLIFSSIHVLAEVTRAKVTEASFRIVDEATNTDEIVTMDTCSGNYEGVQAVFWGNEGFEVLSKAVCEAGPEDCNLLYSIWMNKAEESDPRLPTMLILFDRNKISEVLQEKLNGGIVSGTPGNQRIIATFDSTKLIKTSNNMIIMGACGGHRHPPSGL